MHNGLHTPAPKRSNTMDQLFHLFTNRAGILSSPFLKVYIYIYTRKRAVMAMKKFFYLLVFKSAFMLIFSMLKNDLWIIKMAASGMIAPFDEKQVREGVVSSGVSSYGYDMRVAGEFRVFSGANKTLIDPKDFDPESFISIKGDFCIVPPNSFALARTVEYFRIPRNVLTICLGKSSYARCGIILNVTPFEPEWEGFVTLEISNTTPLPAKIYANEGIAQVLFFEADEECEISYADKKGKYQKQKTIVLPKL